MWGSHPPRFRCPKRLSHLGRLPAHFWRYFYEWCGRQDLNLHPNFFNFVRCYLTYNTIRISQPCIYIISYSVEFVKRFSTLFLFFCAVAFMSFVDPITTAKIQTPWVPNPLTHWGNSVRDRFSLTEAFATASDFLLHPFSFRYLPTTKHYTRPSFFRIEEVDPFFLQCYKNKSICSEWDLNPRHRRWCALHSDRCTPRSTRLSYLPHISTFVLIL